MTTKQMDEMDDRRRLHALLVHDAWAALGLDARILDDYYGREGATREDLWAQILAAIRGNFVSLEADTNPPAPAELIDVARRRHDEAHAFDRLRQTWSMPNRSATEICDALICGGATMDEPMDSYRNGRRPQPGDRVISAHGATKYIAVIDTFTNKVGYLGYWASLGAVTDVLPDGTVVVFRDEVGFREGVGHRYCVAAKHLLVEGDS